MKTGSFTKINISKTALDECEKTVSKNISWRFPLKVGVRVQTIAFDIG
jgi:hypothetical protein